MLNDISVDLQGLIDLVQKIHQAISSIDNTKSFIKSKYETLGLCWNDRKYHELGSIVNDCTKALNELLKVLLQSEKYLCTLAKSIQEYNEVNLNTVPRSQILQIQEPSNNGIQANSNNLNWRRISKYHSIKDDLIYTNPNYNQSREWQINCQRCVPTYEMRRRGYDVTALPANRNGSEHLSYYPFDVWHGVSIQLCSGSGLEQIKSTMGRWGDGARAQIVVIWNNTNSGHTFIAEQVNGRTMFIDPQTGESDVMYYFDSVANGETQFCRIDNLEVSDRIAECCREVL